jgi:hypothetical protein
LNALKGQLNQARLALIENVIAKLDAQQLGYLSLRELR